MPTSTLTTRGQTTIPKPIREALGLQPGDRVEFILHGDRVLLRRAGADLSALDGMLDRSGQELISTGEMDNAIGTAISEGPSASRTGIEAKTEDDHDRN
ncbi:type II toxin-antitoxin system PrlF family antitoxin [Salinibacter ruber]|uniref:AbrB/MazE/SpoVT family DNA-binding domain-containing protein n=1 Tax=Salinibacter ruber TaxID=146919 RepID=UPI002342C8CE